MGAWQDFSNSLWSEAEHGGAAPNPPRALVENHQHSAAKKQAAI
jgi:hypothetical protein